MTNFEAIASDELTSVIGGSKLGALKAVGETAYKWGARAATASRVVDLVGKGWDAGKTLLGYGDKPAAPSPTVPAAPTAAGGDTISI